MATITEDYVSFETAKLLKSKKFHVPTRTHYDTRGGFGFSDICEIDWNNYKCFIKRRCYSAPTLQTAMKWLREVHRIDIIIEISDPSVKDRKYYCMIWDGNNNSYILDLFNSYEEACEAVIKYCLENLIK